MRRPTLATLALALFLLPAAAHAQCLLPPAPTGLSGTIGCGQTSITWNVAPNATSYRLVGRDSFGNQVFSIARAAPSFVYVAGSGNPAQSFTVFAVNLCGEGPASPTVVLPYSAGAPLVQVFSLEASDGTSCESTTITWGDVGVLAPSGYRITRTAAGEPTATFDVPAGQASFTDTTGLAGITYTYAVAVLNPCGVGSARSTTGFRAGVVPGTPTPVVAPRGTTAVLAAPLVTAGNAGATFAWRRGVSPNGTGGTPVVNGPGISGASTTQLTITNVRPEDAALYACFATFCGTTVSSGVIPLVVTTTCATDFDGSGVRTIDDIFIFLNAWFAGCP
jgi:hypothetical protein